MMTSELPRRIDLFEEAPITLETFARSIETVGSMSKYATCLGFHSVLELAAFLEGKTVLDISSGYDGLAIEIILNGINCNLIANNPGRRKRSFPRDRWKNIYHDDDFQNYPSDLIGKAAQLVDITATSHYGQSLPFGSNSFDVVLDVNGLFYYSQSEEVSQLYKAALQMYRVTRPGGHILVGDRFFFEDEGRNPLWKKELIEELNIPYYPLPLDKLGYKH